MKYMRQFGVILLVTCASEIIKYFVPLPVPASIYGLVIMMAALMTKIIKLEQVEEAAVFLIEIMPLMFIPAAVGLLVFLDQLKAMLVPVSVITLFSTIVVMVASGKVTEIVLERKKK